MNSRFSRILAESQQGRVYYCAYRDRMTMCFKERWFAFNRGSLADFRTELASLLKDSPLIESLLAEAFKKPNEVRFFCGEAVPLNFFSSNN